MYTGATGSLFRASLVVSSTAAAAAFYLNKPPAFCQNSDGTPRGALTLVERQQAPSVFLSARESNRVNMLEDSVIVLERQCAQQPLVRVSLEEMVDDLRAHEVNKPSRKAGAKQLAMKARKVRRLQVPQCHQRLKCLHL